jgi:hypothetical protein
MRVVGVFLAAVLAALPVAQRVCDLRCDSRGEGAAAPTKTASHCGAHVPPDRRTPRPVGRGDPCGHEHGTQALLELRAAAKAVATIAALEAEPRPIVIPALCLVRPVEALGAAESPPRRSSPSVLRL